MPILGPISYEQGNMGSELRQRSKQFIETFDRVVSKTREARMLRRAVVRSEIGCNALIALDARHFWIAAEPFRGTTEIFFSDNSDQTLTADTVRDSAVWDFGYRDPFVIGVPRVYFDLPQDQWPGSLEQVAAAWVESERQRTVVSSQLVQLDPIFGPPAFRPDPGLCFVIMPFAEELTEIYNRIVKPSVEEHGLVCRRADDIRTNRAIMNNIWKSICEARLVIAELTRGNENVFYELGIAHTVGKETILISQREESRRPFDVLHLRTIIYRDDADGREELRRELWESIRVAIEPTIINQTS